MAVGPVKYLARYGDYLDTVDKYAQETPEHEYVDLLSPGEALDLLIIRDKLSECELDDGQQRALLRLDNLLIKHHRLVVENVPPYPEKPLARWWWHLHRGPWVREEALAAAERG